MNFIKYADSEMMAMELASKLAGELRQVLKHSDRCTFVVPGGSTPGPVFDALCAADLDWGRVDVMLSDERWVPEVHVRSNTRLVRERLLVDRAARAMFHPLYAKAERPEDVLAELEAGIVPCLPIDVLLLGMGEDMHTASLFPGAEGLAEALAADAPILVALRPKGEREPRISMSARILAGAVSTHLVISGNRKRAAVEKAAHLKADKAPVSVMLEQAEVHWAEE